MRFSVQSDLATGRTNLASCIKCDDSAVATLIKSPTSTPNFHLTAASSSLASARRYSSSSSSSASSPSERRAFFTEDLPSLAAGCASGLPPMLEIEREMEGGEGKKDKGFLCDGDESGSGPDTTSSDRALEYARSLGLGDLNSTTRRSCWGTFRAFWRCPEHKGAGACLECKGERRESLFSFLRRSFLSPLNIHTQEKKTQLNLLAGHHSWLRAPCGAEVAVCDGLLHLFAKFEKESEETGDKWKVFFGKKKR